MKLGKEKILEILPHREPMLLVDSAVLDAERGLVQAQLAVDPAWDVFRGHFPGDPVLPGVYILESMAQTADLLLLWPQENRGKLPVFLGAKQLRLIRPVRPGSLLQMTAELLCEQDGLADFRVKAIADGKRAAAGQIELVLKQKRAEDG